MHAGGGGVDCEDKGDTGPGRMLGCPPAGSETSMASKVKDTVPS